jgi:hypothetical protein
VDAARGSFHHSKSSSHTYILVHTAQAQHSSYRTCILTKPACVCTLLRRLLRWISGRAGWLAVCAPLHVISPRVWRSRVGGSVKSLLNQFTIIAKKLRRAHVLIILVRYGKRDYPWANPFGGHRIRSFLLVKNMTRCVPCARCVRPAS